jgi:hypothetical protein
MKKKQVKADRCEACERIEMRLNTLIVWIAQSANSPISIRDAERLLNEIGRG